MSTREISVSSPAESKDAAFKRLDAESYNAVADQFDLFTQRFTEKISLDMCQMADLPKHGTVLDIGTGTGILASQLFYQSNGSVRIMGVDLSEGMLNFAKQKWERNEGQVTIDFLRMDAECLAVRDNTFDRVLSLYALHHFPNPERAITEMFRVLKPGGRAVIGLGGGPSLFSPAGARAALRKLVSITRGAMGLELRACEFLDQVVLEHISPFENEPTNATKSRDLTRIGVMSNILRDAGFSQIQTDWSGQYSLIESIEEFYQLQMTFSSISRKLLGGADAGTVQQIRESFDRRCERVRRRGGRLVYESGARLITAAKARN